MAGSHWNDSKGGGRAQQLKIAAQKSGSGSWSYGNQEEEGGLEKTYHSTGSRDLAEADRDEVCAVGIINNMGG